MKVALLAFVCLIAGALAWSQEAMKDKIDSLPGQPDGVDFEMFSGYIPVANNTREIFYMFFTSSTGYQNAPLLHTTSGGPGCSGMYFNFIETGPFHANADGTLNLRETRFNRIANTIYVEQPAGVGFSKDHNPNHVWTDDDAATDNHEFLVRFVDRFPEFKNTDLKLNSESYGGHYLPTLAKKLIDNPMGLNFKGFMVGNPLIYMPYRDFGQYATYGNHQLLPYPAYERYKAICTPATDSMPNPAKRRPSECDSLENHFDSLTRGLDPYALDFPVCVNSNGMLESATTGPVGTHTLNAFRRASGKPELDLRASAHDPAFRHLLKGLRGSNDYFPDYDECAEDHTTTYFNRDDVISAIHAVRPSSGRWSTCANIQYSSFDMVESMIPVYDYIMTHGSDKKFVIYSGDNDSICATVEAQTALYGASGFKETKAWAPISVKGQVAGYKSEFSNGKGSLTFMTVHGAGHMTPSTRPAFTYAAFEAFVNNKL
eukprot:TRINITY_DN40417_c0_g1_i1.p1 TRINITY_DN40417_c0_g1~~TRINITY_DN40417_c0_g1_i1.p1  ORF type:complete len:487 (-),score=33.47 TRINITY_DN40417_c0_g1_i1:69-1529(-)